MTKKAKRPEAPPAPVKKPMTIENTVLELPSPISLNRVSGELQKQRRQYINQLGNDEILEMYAPPKTLGEGPHGNGSHYLAMDSIYRECGFPTLIRHAIGLGMDAFEIAPQFLGYPYLIGLSQNALISAGVVTVADDMTKRFIELRRDGKRDDNDIKIKTLHTLFEDFNVKEIFNEAAQKCDFEGGCLVYIDTGEKDPKKLKKPLVMDKSLKGRVKRFTLVEALNLYPGLYNATDPLAPNYFNPDTWLVLGKEIHRSRFLYFAPNQMSILYRAAYNFFGLPISQRVLDYVAHFTKDREAMQRLMTKFSMTILKTNMATILTGGPANELKKRVQLLAQYRDNDSVLAINNGDPNAGGEDVIKLETPLSGVSEIVRQGIEFVAAIFRIPLVKFLGISPGGLNATGQADLTNYVDHIAAKQEKIFRTPIKYVLDVLQLHAFGEIDPQLRCAFIPISDEDEEQRARIQTLLVDAAVRATESRLISSEEGREALSNDDNGLFSGLNPANAPQAIDLDWGSADNPEVTGELVPEKDGATLTQQDTSLSGVQINAMRDIVMSVAAGEIPRGSGRKMLELAYNFSPEEADAVLDEAGNTFKITRNEPGVEGQNAEAEEVDTAPTQPENTQYLA